MLLCLIRHGIAAPRGADVAEVDRPLTPEGVRRMRRSARGLHRLGLEIDTIWTSPLARARQTADIVAAEYAMTGSLHEEPALQPEVDVARVIEQLRKQPKQARIALVGHEPQLGHLATCLLTGLKTSALAFKKGGAACIEIESFRRPIRGQLQWLLTPRQMRKIRKPA
jgi:phosphohistidine phosphatase